MCTSPERDLPCCAAAGLPTMDHYEERTPSPMWPAPSRWLPKRPPAKKKSRMAKGSK